ncbi:hypothetical protein AcV7_010155 [Taiwanofungus camphoratus]|nr:hypothetical protein AcV7_010155 [Antrodia cinnamomea]
MGTSGSALNVPPSAPIPFALPLSSRNCILWTSQVHHMVPRNGTTSLSPHSPHPDQPAPGLSRTPSFLEFAPKRTSSHSQTMRSASVRPATSSGVTEARGLSSCRIRGIVSGRGGLGMSEPLATSRILNAFDLPNARGGWLGVRHPLARVSI